MTGGGGGASAAGGGAVSAGGGVDGVVMVLVLSVPGVGSGVDSVVTWVTGGFSPAGRGGIPAPVSAADGGLAVVSAVPGPLTGRACLAAA